jgi:hypothetical protein
MFFSLSSEQANCMPAIFIFFSHFHSVTLQSKEEGICYRQENIYYKSFCSLLFACNEKITNRWKRNMSRKNKQSEKNQRSASYQLSPSTQTADRFTNNFQLIIRSSLSGARKQDIQWGLHVLHGHIRSFYIAI